MKCFETKVFSIISMLFVCLFVIKYDKLVYLYICFYDIKWFSKIELYYTYRYNTLENYWNTQSKYQFFEFGFLLSIHIYIINNKIIKNWKYLL